MMFAFCKPELEKLARRGENQYTQYKKVDGELTKYQNRDRYAALNWQNDNTVEFRIFRGTLKYETFMASMELCHAAYVFTHDKNCFNIPTGGDVQDVVQDSEKLTDRIFRKFLRFIYKERSSYNNLVIYIRAKNFNIGGENDTAEKD
jgi:hypothetical protein